MVVGDGHESGMTNVAELRTIAIKKEIESERVKYSARKQEAFRLPRVGCLFHFRAELYPQYHAREGRQVARALVNLLVEYQKSQGSCWKGEPDGG